MSTLTIVHVVLSLIGLATGVTVLFNLFGARVPALITAVFLGTTAATSVSGFLFPLAHIGLGQVIGALSLIVLLSTAHALYVRRLAGSWRWIFATGATAALYLNSVVAVAQAFAKVPALHAAAPTHTSPEFLVAQLALLVGFIGLGAHLVGCFSPAEPSALPAERAALSL